MARFLHSDSQPHFGGRQRAKRNRFLHQDKGLLITAAEKKAEAGTAFGPKGHRKMTFGIAHNRFLVKEREKKTILRTGSPGFGKGRGHGHHRKGYHLSAATRAKISAALKGRSHAHKGHPQSAATRAKISASLRKYNATHPAQVKAARAKAAATKKARGEKPFRSKKA